jgi:HAD superfamily hydrolase (TIGR01509 family)
MWSGLRSKFGLKLSVEELIFLEKEAQYLKLSEMPSLPPIDGIEALIETFQDRQVGLSIASSSPVKIIDLILDKAKLASYFKIIVSGQEVGNGKPHLDISHLSSQKLGVASGNCLVIEDSPHGIAGAKAAGMKCIGFQNPNSGNQDLSEADIIIKDFSKSSRQEILDFVCNKIQKVQ